MLKKPTSLLVCLFCLTACQGLALQGYRGAVPAMEKAPAAELPAPEIKTEPQPPRFSAQDGRIAQDYKGLEAWWGFFNDSVLNSLISSGLSMNATQLAEKAEFPKIINTETLEKYYKDKRVDLVNAIVRDYVEYRYVQIQNNLLDEYAALQEMALLEAVGREESKVRNELEKLQDQKTEFAKKLQDASVSLSKSTRLLPEYIDEILKDNQGIPDYDITPIMASSTLIIRNAAKVDAARTELFVKTQGQVGLDETKDILPDTRFNQFFGISENIFVNAHSSWRIKIGFAREQLDYSPLMLHLVHRPQTQEFENSINAYVAEIEGMLVSISTLRDQQDVLEKAATKASQMEAYKALLGALRAEYEKTKTIIKLFEALDLY